MKTEHEILKKKFKDILLKTKRDGIQNVLDKLEELGFFKAPSSTKYHGCYEGGLLEHSMNVYTQAMYLANVQKKLVPMLKNVLDDDSITIASLLHDVCKADLYKITTKWRKDDKNKWVSYEAYEQDYSNTIPIGHGEKSVIRLLQWGLKLTDDEIMAIRWHMSAFDLSQYSDAKSSFNEATSKSILASIIISADWLASKILENENFMES